MERNMAVVVARAGEVEVGVVEGALTVAVVAVVAEGAEGASQAIGKKAMGKAMIRAQVIRMMRKRVTVRSQKKLFLHHHLLHKPR